VIKEHVLKESWIIMTTCFG